MKAEKRVRYGEKEKARLLKMVEQSQVTQKEWDEGRITRKAINYTSITKRPHRLRRETNAGYPSIHLSLFEPSKTL